MTIILPEDQTEFLIAWDASSDDHGIFGYEIGRDGIVIGQVDPSTLSYNVTDLDPGHTYLIAVRALDIDGLASGWSEPLSVMIPFHSASTQIGTTWHLLRSVTSVRSTTWNVDRLVTQVSITRETTWHTLAPIVTASSTLMTWDGNGLTNGSAVIVGTAGTGDTPVTAINGSPTVSTTDTQTPSIVLDMNTGDGVRWTVATMNLLEAKIRLYYKQNIATTTNWMPIFELYGLGGNNNSMTAYFQSSTNKLQMFDEESNVIYNATITGLTFNTWALIEAELISRTQVRLDVRDPSTGALLGTTGVLNGIFNAGFSEVWVDCSTLTGSTQINIAHLLVTGVNAVPRTTSWVTKKSITRTRATTWDIAPVTDSFAGDGNLHDRATEAGGGTWKGGPTWNPNGSSAYGVLATSGGQLFCTLDQYNNNFSMIHPDLSTTGRQFVFDYSLVGTTSTKTGPALGGIGISPANGGEIQVNGVTPGVATGIGTTGTATIRIKANGDVVVLINGVSKWTGNVGALSISATATDFVWTSPGGSSYWDNFKMGGYA